MQRPSSPRSGSRWSPWSLLLGGGLLATLLLGQWMWVVAILGLALLITLHELGHFLVAKACGMRVEQFSIGFPPTAVSFTRGETEYGIGLIPLGGFCKISGMTPEEPTPEGTGDRAYYRRPIWQRSLTIAAGPLMNFLAAAVILILFIGIAGVPKTTLTLGEVVAGGPAAKAGLTAGATLVGANEQRWTSWEQAAAFFRANPNKKITLRYLPAGERGAAHERTLALTLGENPKAKGSGYLGVAAGVVRERPGPFTAVKLGLIGFKDIAVGTFKGFGMLFSGKVNVAGPDGAVGPIGIIDVSRDAVQQNWYPALLAFLSFNLGLINLLPLLPFDGGHLVINLLEKLRGRRLSAVLLERMAGTGTALLVLLFLALTFNDIKRLLGF